jgi:peptidoglycan hydrolase CwlO-like protein
MELLEKIIPWTISFVSLIILIITFFKNGNKEQKEDTKQEDTKFTDIEKSLLKANLKLDQLCATTSETRTDIKSLNKDLNSLSGRVTVVERDLKTAFEKIDELKGKIV